MKINHMPTAAIQSALHNLNNPKPYNLGKPDAAGNTPKVYPSPMSNSAYAGHLRAELNRRGVK